MNAPPRLAVRRASAITPTTVRWLWEARIAAAKLNIIGGAPGLGKSYLATYLAAAVSRGTALPGDPRQDATPGTVLILSYEDDPEDTIRPRLEQLGADLDRVDIIEGVHDGKRQRALGPDDVALVGVHAVERGDVQLVIIDPVSAFVGAATDEHRGNEIRAALEDLRMLAQRIGFAVVLVMHTRKSGADTALNRLAGSQAYGALVRSAVMVAPITDDEQGRCALAHVKHNLAAKQPTLAYTVDGNGVQWHGEVVIDEDEVAGNGDDDRRSGREEATAFLRDVLADGPTGAADIRRQASDVGIASRTLDRAKKSLGVTSVRDGVTWSWELPTSPRMPTSPHVTLGEHGDLGVLEPCQGCDRPSDRTSSAGTAWCTRCWDDAARQAAS